MSIVVGGGDGTVIAIALNRAGSDFSDAERRLLDRLRGPLAVAHANTEQYGRVRAALDEVSTAAGRGVVTLDRAGVRLLAIGGQGWVLVVERESPSAVWLSPREREVLALVADGATDVDVGSQLGLSARTVQKHLEHIYARLGVANRTAAVTQAIRMGLVHLVR